MYEEKKKKNGDQKKENYRFFTFQKQKKNSALYSELLTNINWNDLIKKLTILLLSIIIIIFTISRINKYSHNKIVASENLTMLKNSIYNYLKNQPLPKNTGDSFSLTLEQMQKLEIINEIKEKNVLCDTLNSYTILTKINANEYNLKIHLICPNSNNTLEENINFNV